MIQSERSSRRECRFEISFQTRAEKEQSSEKPPLIMSLPDDVIVDILARVPRSNYPNLSLVSKHFRSLLASPELYVTRSLLGCTEPYIYSLVLNEAGYRWYILRRKADNNNQLLLIPLLPAISSIAIFVAVGLKIYVFGGIDDTSFSIDCRFHTVQPLPVFPIPMIGRFCDIIDGKIYIIGEYLCDFKKKVMVVFNIESQMWEPGVTELEMELDNIYFRSSSVVVMADKIYMNDSHNTFVYTPKERKLEKDKMLNSKRWEHVCVVDEILYYYDCNNNKLRMYDPKQNGCAVVEGVGKLLHEAIPLRRRSHTVNYGGKILVFLHRYDNSSK